MTHTRIPLSLIALAIVWLIAVQIGTNIRIDAGESVGTLLDRAPFYVSIAVGVLLLAHQPAAMIRWKVLIASTLFFLHLFAVLMLTSDVPLRSFLIPNYGIVSWMLLGMASHVAVLTLERRIESDGPRSMWPLVIWLPTLSLAFLIWGLRAFTDNPGRVDSYQFPAANLIVLLLLGLLALDRWSRAWEARRGRRSSALPALTFLALGTASSYFVSRMDSTAIVAVWSGLALVLIWRFGISQGWTATFLFAAVGIATALMFPAADLLQTFFAETRFDQLRSGSSILELSSLTSRLDILPSFAEQFSVSPWFGHMQAELVSGAGVGNWVHSLPLAALTHTGLVGATLLFAASFFACEPGRRSKGELFPVLMFGLVLLMASAIAFFTWVPFWFMLGYLAIRASPRRGTVPGAPGLLGNHHGR
ncbi:hypothetical protein JI739_04325 [Ramlibacter sp. AW1]|uniref:O-antigen ligase domain-containing protein n=1 Tax=Ramlibacter aurantiacus TaxID=2801330 RepID=A0A937D2B2_9BURK|nr:hypothetical protein [Ramlibacter aurantiacus]MBL0419570.1 hypothetical protein [Ramlibacter aurantiacus]